jgi:CheY-like chemotaxis protein
MSRVRLFHFKAAEAGPLIAILRAAGHKVEYDEKMGTPLYQAIRAAPPDAFVIDLTRMPSHGRYVAFGMRQSPKTRHVPIVFVDGDAEKVAITRQQVPDAFYTPRAKVVATIKKAVKSRVENPVKPDRLFSYHTRTAAQKMGIAKDARVGVIDGPRDYERVLGEVPEGVEFVEGAQAGCSLLIWFLHDPDVYLEMLPRIRACAARSKVWVLWKKGGTTRTGAVTQPLIREAAQEFGMVDYKICSVDKNWSGIALTLKKAALKKPR